MRNLCPFLHWKTKRDLVRSLFNARFLNSLTIDILELIILLGGGGGEPVLGTTGCLPTSLTSTYQITVALAPSPDNEICFQT